MGRRTTCWATKPLAPTPVWPYLFQQTANPQLISLLIVRIGLVRHFPVQEPLPTGWKTAAQLAQWRKDYEASEPILGTQKLTSEWDRCLSSDLQRASATATAIYSGPIEFTSLLREADVALFRTGSLRLPIWIWKWILRFSWMTGHSSQKEIRDAFFARILAITDRLDSERKDTLVVSHAGVMMYLSKALVARGFEGPKFKFPIHAHLYEFVRE